MQAHFFGFSNYENTFSIPVLLSKVSNVAQKKKKDKIIILKNTQLAKSEYTVPDDDFMQVSAILANWVFRKKYFSLHIPV